MKYAAFGIDSNPTYAFFAPLTAAMWNVMGYQALVLCVGSRELWAEDRLLSIVHRRLDSFGVNVDSVAGHRTSTVAQVARIYAYVHVAESDYILTTDADMWPLSRSWFETGECKPGEFAILNANNRTRFPMCYLGAHGSTWGEVLGRQGALSDLIERHLTCDLVSGGAAIDAWLHDEEFITGRIHAWPGYPSRCLFANRGTWTPGRGEAPPPEDRIDRADWPRRFDVKGKVDAHLIRPGYTDENWPRLVELIRVMCPSILDWAERYRREFVEAMRG